MVGAGKRRNQVYLSQGFAHAFTIFHSC